MHAPSSTVTPPTPPPIPPQSLLIRILLSERSYRHPRFWLRVRLAIAIWNLFLGLALVSSAHWIGQYAWLGLISLTGSALLFVTVVHLRRYLQGKTPAATGACVAAARDR